MTQSKLRILSQIGDAQAIRLAGDLRGRVEVVSLNAESPARAKPGLHLIHIARGELIDQHGARAWKSCRCRNAGPTRADRLRQLRQSLNKMSRPPVTSKGVPVPASSSAPTPPLALTRSV